MATTFAHLHLTNKIGPKGVITKCGMSGPGPGPNLYFRKRVNTKSLAGILLLDSNQDQADGISGCLDYWL